MLRTQRLLVLGDTQIFKMPFCTIEGVLPYSGPTEVLATINSASDFVLGSYAILVVCYCLKSARVLCPVWVVKFHV